MPTLPISISFLDAQITELSAAPQILPKLQKIIRDGNTNPDDIFTLIKLDQALAARVIKTSNCAFFSPRSRINNISDAVTLLGYDEVYRIISLVAFSKIFSWPLRSYGLSGEDIWRKSVGCALTLEALAQDKRTNTNNGYTVGLLHAIGMIFVDKHLAIEGPVPLANGSYGDEPVLKKELEVLGVTHAEVAAHVLRKWNFPEEITEPIKYQYNPLACLTFGKMACLLNLAKDISNAILAGEDDDTISRPDPLILSLIGVSQEEFLRLIRGVRVRLSEIELLLAEL